jgi:hypothetical protein
MGGGEGRQDKDESHGDPMDGMAVVGCGVHE